MHELTRHLDEGVRHAYYSIRCMSRAASPRPSTGSASEARVRDRLGDRLRLSAGDGLNAKDTLEFITNAYEVILRKVKEEGIVLED